MANSKTKSRKKFKIKKIPKYDNGGTTNSFTGPLNQGQYFSSPTGQYMQQPQSYTTDPKTGYVIDPNTGQPLGQTQQNQGNATGAVTAGIGTMGVIQSQSPQTSEFSIKISNQQCIVCGIAT